YRTLRKNEHQHSSADTSPSTHDRDNGLPRLGQRLRHAGHWYRVVGFTPMGVQPRKTYLEHTETRARITVLLEQPPTRDEHRAVAPDPDQTTDGQRLAD